TGICCTSIDASRYSPRAKIIGPMSWQLRYIRSGIPDVIVVDEQCVRTDAFSEASAAGTPFIATSDKNCMGLPDRTNDPADAIVADLTTGRQNGVLILDPEKAGEVAVRVARTVMPARRKASTAISPETIRELASDCPVRSLRGVRQVRAGLHTEDSGAFIDCGCGSREDKK